MLIEATFWAYGLIAQDIKFYDRLIDVSLLTKLSNVEAHYSAVGAVQLTNLGNLVFRALNL